MEFSISTLLDSFEDKLVAPKILEKKLACEEPKQAEDLQITLEALAKLGVLAKERGKYRRVHSDDVVEGKLRCSSKGFCFAIQSGEDTEDIYIRESQLSSAWNGDRVLVRITKEGRRRRSPEGEVHLILERSNPSVLAHVKENKDGDIRAFPLDDRLLFELALQDIEGGIKIADAKDQLVHTEILRYPLGSSPPLGKVVKVLGSDAQSAEETELVFCKYDLPATFPSLVEATAQELPKKLRKADQKKRELLQKVTTVTFSNPNHAPYGLDHAFSIEQTKEGHWQVGIHVVDFTPFVPLSSPLSEEAQKRAACITLSDQIVPIFPETFMDRVGGLTAKAERLAFSLMVTCNDAGEVQSFDLQPSVIKVDSNLDESLVAQALERDRTKKPTKDLKSVAPYLELIDQLDAIAQKLKTQRYQRGSFDLQTPDVRTDVFGDNGLHGAAVLSAPE
ncbi:MAG: RNB domain-containing ribonuclease, partial [Cyanobacteria bacterium P01_F01_bin.42]